MDFLRDLNRENIQGNDRGFQKVGYRAALPRAESWVLNLRLFRKRQEKSFS